jgi:O-antigen ligase
MAIFLLPLYLIRIKLLFFSSNSWEVISEIIFIVWFLKEWKNINLKEFYSNYKRYIISAAIILFGLMASSLLNDNLEKNLGIIKSWFLIPIALMFVIISSILKEKIEKIFWFYYFSCFFVAVISLTFLFLGKMSYDGRLQSIFNSPNYLAMYLSPSLIIGAVLKQNCKSKFMSLFFLSSLVILISFYFTFSYAAWISTFVSVFVIFLMKNKISFKKIFIIAIILILLTFSQLKSSKLNDLVTFHPRSSLASRFMIWQSAGKILKDNWIIGIGSANFQNKYLEYQKYYPPYLEWAVPHPHNLYLAFWFSGGIAGLTGFLFLIGFLLKDICYKIKNESDSLAFISLGILLCILIHGLVDTTYFKNDLSVVFWLCFLILKK